MRAFLFLCLFGGVAYAQSATTGAIQGTVRERGSESPLVGISIIVTQDDRTVGSTLTEANGTYKIDDLPPGEYTVTFYDGDRSIAAGHVPVSAQKVTPLYQTMLRDPAAVDDKDGPGSKIYVESKLPPIDTVNVVREFTADRDYLDHMPVPGHTFEAVLGGAAGAQNDGIGPAFSGSTSLENRYLVDGIDVTGLTFGNVGTPVPNVFIQEIEVITGGYNAEYGRATGGIANVVTRSGTNTLRGSVFASIQPGILTAPAHSTPINASSVDITADRAYSANYGFELGGPIVKDRAWFYVGLAPEVSRTDFTRTTKRETDCRVVQADGTLSICNPKTPSQGGFANGIPDIDPKTGFFITDSLDSEVRTSKASSYAGFAKVNLAVSPENQAQVELIALPSSSHNPGLVGLANSGEDVKGLTTDAMGKWTAKMNDSHTEIDATVAWHRSTLENIPLDPTLANTPRQLLEFGDLGTWSALGGESQTTAQGCHDGGAKDPYAGIVNCPMQTESYAIGGIGAITHDKEERRAVRVGVTERFDALGNHELKGGIDVDDDTKELARMFSGGSFIENQVGTQVRVTRWAQLQPATSTDPRFDHTCTTPNPFVVNTHGGEGTSEFKCAFVSDQLGQPGTIVGGETFNTAAYLRDSWQILPNLTLNLGLRYEAQQLRYAKELQNTTDPLTGDHIGKNAMSLDGNLAPRLGISWDPTRQGKAKIFGSFGRFYESIPMDINDRSFGGEVSYQQTFNVGSSGTHQCGPDDPTIGHGPNGLGCLNPNAKPDSQELIGSSGVLVAPGIKSEYLDEGMVGFEVAVGASTKVGALYQNRRLGRVIEDVSPDGAQTYLIANPGEWDKSEEDKLKAQIAHASTNDEKQRLQHELTLFQGIRLFDKPSRNYDALELTVQRRFTGGLYINGSYTYSRTEGNYPGSVSYDNGQIDPNISSQYDLIELLSNRNGPLPQDRPHSFKLDSYWVHNYDFGALTLGGRFRAISGVPENALGGHYLYGPNESFLLPRGILGRTEFDHGVDVHVALARKLKHGMTGELYVDVFNVYNRQGTFGVDDNYAPSVRGADGHTSTTANNVNPISGGSYDDLIFAKQIDANGNETSTPTARNPNFHQATSRYAPASAQIGFKLTF